VVAAETLKDKDNEAQQESISQSEVKEPADVSEVAEVNQVSDVKGTALANEPQAEIEEVDVINEKTVESSEVAIADVESRSESKSEFESESESKPESQSVPNPSGKVAAGVVAAETLKDKDNEAQQESIAQSVVGLKGEDRF